MQTLYFIQVVDKNTDQTTRLGRWRWKAYSRSYIFSSHRLVTHRVKRSSTTIQAQNCKQKAFFQIFCLKKSIASFWYVLLCIWPFEVDAPLLRYPHYTSKTELCYYTVCFSSILSIMWSTNFKWYRRSWCCFFLAFFLGWLLCLCLLFFCRTAWNLPRTLKNALLECPPSWVRLVLI